MTGVIVVEAKSADPSHIWPVVSEFEEVELISAGNLLTLGNVLRLTKLISLLE
ncbi:hypothetical protein [Okeania sp.]|uniref:hypothetical protein n=1 Tax=Okeania sp. TaxID=3100323 RepID=UPI002B4ABF12|nr:hypothetical protein [Okeania sp.]